MNCLGFETRLEAFLAGALSPAETEAAGRHLRGCERCGDLLELARVAIRPEDPEAAVPPPELVADVLRETAGSACLATERALCEHVDGALPAARSELVEAHLSACSGCRALAGALSALARDLPTLAEIRPDARFVDAVLAATLPWHVRLGRWWRRGWPRWVARPRFAAEAAYVTTLIVVLVFSTTGSPLEAMPKRAGELAQRALPGRSVGDAWARLEETVAPKLQVLSRSEATRAVLGSWRATAELGSRAVERSVELGGDAYGWAARNIRTFWQWLASMLERAGETTSAADRDSDEEKR